MLYGSGQRIESQFTGSDRKSCEPGYHEFDPDDKGTVMGSTEVRNRDL